MEFSILLDPIYEANQLVALSQQIEKLGFTSIWYPDEKYFHECYIGLTLMASSTSEVRLGPCVTEPYLRHPILTAASIATLSEVVPGRIWLGIGAGGRGLSNVNVPRRKPTRAIREAVEVIRRLLKGEVVDFQGEVISLNECGLDFSPREVVPVMIGTGHGHLVQELSGEIADAVMVANVTAEKSIRNSVERIAKGAKKGKRELSDLHMISRVDIAIHPDRNAAKRAVAPKVLSAVRSSYPHLNYLKDFPEMDISSNLLQVLGKKDYLSKEYYAVPERADALISEELAENLAIFGSEEEVITKLKKIIDLDIFDEITLRPVQSEGQSMADLLTLLAATVNA